MKYIVEFERLESCMLSLGDLERAKEEYHFDEWPVEQMKKLRKAMNDLWDSAERV